MSLSSEVRALIKKFIDYKFKKYSSRRILTKVLMMKLQKRRTGDFTKRLRKTRSSYQRHESGR